MPDFAKDPAANLRARGLPRWIAGALALLALTPSLVVAASGLVPSRIVERIDASQVVELPGHIHRAVRDSQDLGPADPALRADRLLLLLRASPSQDDALRAFLRAAQTRGNPQYRRWLTPQAFEAQFGVAAADRATIRSWLATRGITVVAEPAGGRALVVSATVRQLADTFGAQIHRYQWRGQQHLASTTNPTIPRALAGVIRGFASLHDFRHQPQFVRGLATPLYTGGGGTHYLAPADFATIYDLATPYGQGLTGSGRSIAVLGRSDVPAADLATFRSAFGLPALAPQVIVNGTDPGRVAGDETESALDLEWAGAVAPGASVLFVTSRSTALTDGIDLSAQYAVSGNVADVISLSYGSCESSLDVSGGTTLYNQLWQQAAAQGISVFVASGDAGAAGCNAPSAATATAGLGVNRLCSSPYSTCVGGTQFDADTANPSAYWSASNSGAGQSSALAYIPEVVWNQSGTNLYASGGGASIYYAKPPWQLATGVPSDGLRDVPDVALSGSGAHDPYLIYSSDGYATSTLLAVGGTSAATPAMAGIAALVAQKQAGRVGSFNPVLYGLSDLQAGGGAAVFHRITRGNNSVPGQVGFSASTGDPTYNQATGLGSVDAALLVAHWNDYAGTTAGLSPATATVPAGAGVGSAVLTLPATTTWSAVVASSGRWLSVTPTSGTGSAPLSFAAAANTSASARIATITIAGQVLTITQAAGSGSAAQGALSVTSLAFGSDPIGATTGSRRVLVSNTGGAPLTLGPIAVGGSAAGDYTESGSCATGLVLAVGASCYVDVRFDATAAGTRNASLSIGITGSTALSVALAGTGITGSSDSSGGDGPLPPWSFAALGVALIGIARRRLRRDR